MGLLFILGAAHDPCGLTWGLRGQDTLLLQIEASIPDCCFLFSRLSPVPVVSHFLRTLLFFPHYVIFQVSISGPREGMFCSNFLKLTYLDVISMKFVIEIKNWE